MAYLRGNADERGTAVRFSLPVEPPAVGGNRSYVINMFNITDKLH